MSQEVASFCFHEVTDDPQSTEFQQPGAVPFTLPRRRGWRGHFFVLTSRVGSSTAGFRFRFTVEPLGCVPGT